MSTKHAERKDESTLGLASPGQYVPEKKYEGPAWSDRQVVAAEHQARAIDALAGAVTALARVLAGWSDAPAIATDRPSVPADDKEVKEKVRQAMVAVAKARGGDFLAALLKGKFGCESIAGLRPERYEEAVAALTAAAAAAAGVAK